MLSTEQVWAIHNTMTEADYRNAVLVMAFAGLRIGKAVALRWSDVGDAGDADAQQLGVRHRRGDPPRCPDGVRDGGGRACLQSAGTQGGLGSIRAPPQVEAVRTAVEWASEGGVGGTALRPVRPAETGGPPRGGSGPRSRKTLDGMEADSGPKASGCKWTWVAAYG